MIPAGIMSFAGAAFALSSTATYYFTVMHYKAHSYELSKKTLGLYALLLSAFALYACSCLAAAGYMLYSGPAGTEQIVVSSLLLAFNAALFTAVFFYGRSIRAFTKKRLSDMLEMVGTLEAKDLYTKGHSVHVCKLAGWIYDILPKSAKARIRKIKLLDAALFHDIGKIRIPLDIINKVGRLSDHEYLIMTTHPRNGSDMLEATQYGPLCPYILYHHERIDGKGYYKLKGRSIPIESRIIAVADTFSALYSDRSYRKKFPFEKAMEIIKQSAGTQLDEGIVNFFGKLTRQQADALTAE